MTNSINSLANMELMLYGGASGFNANCPSFTNGYKATNNTYSNPYFNPYMMGYNKGFYPNQYQATQNNSIFNQGLTAPTQGQYNVTSQAGANDLKVLEDYYKKVNSMRQEWSGLPMAAGMIGFTECAQNMKHFWNSGKAIGITNKVFDMSNSTIKALWNNNPELMQRAYGQLHAVNRSAQSKIPLVQKWFQKPIAEADRKVLSDMMEAAIKSGDEKAILKATETLKASRGMDGYIPTAWNKLKNLFGFNGKNYTPMERIANKSAEIDKIVSVPKAVKPGVSGLLKQGVKEGKSFALFGMIIDLPKIISAYKLGGVDSAIKQIGQTGIRSLADGIGWTLGRAAGGWLGTKAGAALGTMICPGVGTAIGAILGFVGGAAGSIIASQITHSFMPDDEATKLEAKAKTQTAQGRSELLSLVTQNAQMGEKVPEKVLIAAQNVANAMQA